MPVGAVCKLEFNFDTIKLLLLVRFKPLRLHGRELNLYIHIQDHAK